VGPPGVQEGWRPCKPQWLMSIFQSGTFCLLTPPPHPTHDEDCLHGDPNRSRPCPCRPRTLMGPAGSTLRPALHRRMRMMAMGAHQGESGCNPLRSGPRSSNCAGCWPWMGLRKPAYHKVRRLFSRSEQRWPAGPFDSPLHWRPYGLNDWYVRVVMFNQKIYSQSSPFTNRWSRGASSRFLLATVLAVDDVSPVLEPGTRSPPLAIDLLSRPIRACSERKEPSRVGDGPTAQRACGLLQGLAGPSCAARGSAWLITWWKISKRSSSGQGGSGDLGRPATPPPWRDT